MDETVRQLQQRVTALEQALSARTCELEVLHELSAQLGQAPDDEGLFHTLIVHLDRCLDTDVAAGLLNRADRDPVFFLRTRQALDEDARGDLLQRMSSGLELMGGKQTAIESLATVDVRDDGNEPDPASLRQLQSFFQVPILSAGQPVGMIALAAGQADFFVEDQIRLVYTVAAQASAAVERITAVYNSERQRLQVMTDHLEDGVILLDADQRVTAANPAGREFLAALTSQSHSERLTHFDGHSFEEIARESEHGQGVDVVTEDDERRILAVSIVSLRDSPLPDRWMAVLRDVTEFRDAAHRRDRFMAMLAHELRNPLAALMNAGQLLEYENLPEETRTNAAGIMIRQTQHMARLVDDLLDVSRFLHGKITFTPQHVNLVQLLRETVQTYDAQAEAKGLAVHLTLPRSAHWVNGDPNRLIQLFSNLLGNAIKYTPAGGHVWITCTVAREEVLVTVRDSGIGLDEEKCGNIFEPFIQIEDTLARSEGGLGLGLALVRLIAEQHSGHVSVQSDGPGQGSTFTVRLTQIDPPPVEDEADSASTEPLPSLEILLVEDQPDARETLKTLFELEGHRVHVAADGHEGIHQFRTHRPPVTLIDIGLPGLNGYQVARTIREEFERTPVLVALTGYGEIEARRAAQAAGFDHHLTKPVNLDQLRTVLQACLRD